MEIYDLRVTGSFDISSSNQVLNITASYAMTASYVSGSSSVSASYALSSSHSDSSSYTSMSMGNLNDVSLTGLQNGYVLSYDTGQQKWVPTAMAASVVSVFSLIINSIGLVSFPTTTTGIEVL